MPKHGDIREDGFRFHGWTPKGYENWYSPIVWENRNNWRKNNPIKIMVNSARIRALKKGMEFSLLAQNIEMPTHCPIFGTELLYGGAGKRSANSASLDRIDNSKGYVEGNVMIISRRANALKGDATPIELRRLADFYERFI